MVDLYIYIVVTIVIDGTDDKDFVGSLNYDISIVDEQ